MKEITKVVVDAMGGDNAPHEIIKGAVEAVGKSDAIHVILVGKEDVIIGISFPRYSMRTLKAMEFANNRSAKVITLTDSVHSPMNLYSSCNLIADSDMASIVDSLVAPLSVINALIVALCMKNRKKVAKTLEMLEDIWDEYQVYESDEINYIDDSIKMRYGKIGDTEFNE